MLPANSQNALDRSQVQEFLDYYLDTVMGESSPNALARGVERFIAHGKLEQITDELAKIIENNGTIFTFGNGGSDAFAQHLAFSLRISLNNRKIRIFENPSLCYCQHISQSQDYDLALSEFLKQNGITGSGLVLFSASGNSNNVIKAAKTAKKLGIKTFSFTGFKGGKLKPLTDFSVNSQILDQQPAEDSNQIILHLMVLLLKLKFQKKKSLFKKEKARYLGSVSKSLEKIDSEFIAQLSKSIVKRYLENRKVFVYAPEGGAISITSDHIAHNLQWDAILNVANPPTIQLNSSLLSTQYSGISNDRRGHFAHGLQIRVSANPGDLLLLFASEPNSKSVKHTILEALEKGLEVFLITSSKQKNRFKKVKELNLGATKGFVFSDVAQIIGHILGRLVRLELMISLNQSPHNIARYLIENDLAQLMIKKEANIELKAEYRRLEKKWIQRE